MRILLLVVAVTVMVLLVNGVNAQHDHHPASQTEEPKSEKTYLLDEFGKLGHCDFTGRFDSFFTELSNDTSAHGHIIFYKGADALPAHYDDSSHERAFRNHLAFRNFDANRITIVDGGFREEARTEVWMVLPGGEPPQPRKNTTRPAIPVDKTFLYDSTSPDNDEGSGLEEFVLPSVQAARDALLAAQEEEYKAEMPDEDSATTGDAEPAPDSVPEEGEEEAFVDTRTPEEIEAERFSWTSDKFGHLLADRKDTSGVIIFYADDEIYDINKLRQFIEQGKKRIATAAGIRSGRISIQFGGFRPWIQTEFWVVPKKGAKPKPKPEERPAEQPEENVEASEPEN